MNVTFQITYMYSTLFAGATRRCLHLCIIILIWSFSPVKTDYVCGCAVCLSGRPVYCAYRCQFRVLLQNVTRTIITASNRLLFLFIDFKKGIPTIAGPDYNNINYSRFNPLVHCIHISQSQYRFQLLQSQFIQNEKKRRYNILKKTTRFYHHRQRAALTSSPPRSSTRLSQFQFKREIFLATRS